MNAVLILGGSALLIILALAVTAETYIRRAKRQGQRGGRIAAWEQAEPERVGPEVYHGREGEMSGT